MEKRDHKAKVELRKSLDRLKDDRKSIVLLAGKINQAHGGVLYYTDFLANAAAQRAYELSRGFQSMVQQQNYLCAGSLVRLQLDTALRFSAAFMVDDPHEFARQVMEGTEVRKLKDWKGKQMTDKYLVECVKNDHPWVESLYERTCGYIHFSDVHVRAPFQSFVGNKFEFRIGAGGNGASNEWWVETIGFYRGAWEVLLLYLTGWLYTKSKPEVAVKIRERMYTKVVNEGSSAPKTDPGTTQ